MRRTPRNEKNVGNEKNVMHDVMGFLYDGATASRYMREGDAKQFVKFYVRRLEKMAVVR